MTPPPASQSAVRAGRPVVTALRARDRERVAVDLDGAPWRVVPLEAALLAGLDVGVEIDRERARALRRALRRIDARAGALRALRSRDHTRASLERRLESRGTAPEIRRETVDAVERAGLIDDRRFALERAALLARRGAGDLLVAHDLEQQGVDAALVAEALAALEPEAARAARIVAVRGRSPKTARYLAGKGFSEPALEELIADLEADGVR